MVKVLWVPLSLTHMRTNVPMLYKLAVFKLIVRIMLNYYASIIFQYTYKKQIANKGYSNKKDSTHHYNG